MNNVLFRDKETSHRVFFGNVRRKVFARYDYEGNFVHFVIHRTAVELRAAQKAYGVAKVGIASWFEIFEHNFS
ncbi:MAG: hypothetical protein KGL39_00565 [Patescibacteria group bacterium]|nr:hypothetical protein [Patescibacteria group bacterium]